MKYYKLALQKYFVFSGRSNRSEYWYFALFNLIFVIVAAVLDNMFGMTYPYLPYGIFYTVYSLAVFIPGLSVLVRRLHDTNRSGWFFLIALIPLIGAIWLLVILASKGTEGDNKYGPDPNGEGPVFDFERAGAES